MTINNKKKTYRLSYWPKKMWRPIINKVSISQMVWEKFQRWMRK